MKISCHVDCYFLEFIDIFKDFGNFKIDATRTTE